jgi:uncharacterized repeat protein (TIGR01451 family)
MSESVFVELHTKLNFCIIKKYLRKSSSPDEPKMHPTFAFLTQTQQIMYLNKIRFLLFAAFVLLTLGLRAQSFCNLTVTVDPPVALSCQNPSVQLQTSVTPAGNYQYQWSGPVQLSAVPNPVVTIPGTYTVFVTDGFECFGGDTVIVTGNTEPVAIEVFSADCDGNVSLKAIAGNPAGGPHTYFWSTGETTETISAPTNISFHCVTITNSSGCSGSACITLNEYQSPEVTFIYTDSPFCNDSVGLIAWVLFGQPAFTFLWNTGQTSPAIDYPDPGTYVVTVTDSRGCSDVASFVIENTPDECANIEGHVLADWNTNCTRETSDDPLSNFIVHITNATGEERFVYTDSDGFYRTEVDPGTYTVEILLPNSLWMPCQSSVQVTLNANDSHIQDFLIQPEAVCPAMTVDLGTPFLRRCFSGNYWISYCNQGTANATGAYVDIQMDPFLSVASASVGYTDLGNDLYRFDLGDVPFNTCGSFSVSVSVSCEASLGQTHCTEAVIYPTGNCEPSNAQWSGASLQIEAECKADSVEFTVRNVGVGVSNALEYVIIEDAVMLMQAPPPTISLDPGAVHIVKVPANGATWRMEVEQEPFHPGFSAPSQTVEGCVNGASFSIGFVNQFAFDDNDAWVDIDCTPNVGAYDPNDKQGFPIGYGAARQIEPGTDLEYLIRFQNTGTDTAFTVVIRDTLSAWLDPATVRPGASSHPYTFDFYGGTNLKFTFDNILLPDSNTNLAGSQGFISFKIAQKSGVPLQTEILNSAAIFFDFNEPVITNTTVHRIGKDFVTLSAWQPFRSGLELRVLPNPVAQSAVLELRGIEGLQDWQVELRDALGRPVLMDTANGDQWRFERGNLPAGLYLLQVHANGQLLGSGKVVLR